MKVLAFPTHEDGFVTEMTFEEVQKYVCGYVETVTLPGNPRNAVLMCNEDAKNMRIPPNRWLEEPWLGDYIAGRFVIAGADMEKEEFCDISEKDIEYYKSMFDKKKILTVFDHELQQWKDVKKEEEGKTFLFYDLLQCEEWKYKFMSYKLAEGKIRKEDYRKIYHGTVQLMEGEGIEAVLERLFYIHNAPLVDDSLGHSMSVSDVVVIYRKEEKEYYYVDSFGFKKLEKFE